MLVCVHYHELGITIAIDHGPVAVREIDAHLLFTSGFISRHAFPWRRGHGIV